MKKSSDGKTLLQFKYDFPCSVDEPITPVKIFSGGHYLTTSVVWDTGAKRSCISRDLASRLQLVPLRQEYIVGAVGSPQLSDICKVSVQLLDNLTGDEMHINDLEVNVADMANQDRTFLLGMNAIQHGKFTLENIEDSFTRLTFEVTISQ